jgi:HEAT repeat protein
LKYLLETQTIGHILKIFGNLFAQNIVKDHIYIDLAFSRFSYKEKTDDDFEQFFEMLKSDNVFLRNATIKYLQGDDEQAIVFIEKLLKNPDKDIRIFAINILGDVKYDKSVDMLRFFIAAEEDINAMMTAVDYLGEIGTIEDIALLESVKITHKDDPFVVFGVDMACERIKG